ncbi:hypothetical protein [Thiococcus pfennigii]|uniref:hypothetical protein n=1 Tax=Thiococcus pfennigii TaxID=1057 RepID=UPI001903E94F|nr:hypothetical protein [Thiococcus pfennigii]MBK1699738.1 hypothetical protein [Thiococcus pfennigii]
MSAPVVANLEAIYDAVLARQRSHFGQWIAQYGFYEPDLLVDEERSLQTPALLIGLEDFAIDEELDRRQVDGRIAVRLTLLEYAFLSVATANLQRQLDVLGLAVAAHIFAGEPGARASDSRGNRWGLGAACRPPTRLEGQPGDLKPGRHGADSRLIRWEQVFFLPEDARPDWMAQT